MNEKDGLTDSEGERPGYKETAPIRAEEIVWKHTGERDETWCEEAHIWLGKAGWTKRRAKGMENAKEMWRTLHLLVRLDQKVHEWLAPGCHAKEFGPYRYEESTRSS